MALTTAGGVCFGGQTAFLRPGYVLIPAVVDALVALAAAEVDCRLMPAANPLHPV